MGGMDAFVLDYSSRLDKVLQQRLEEIDGRLRETLGIEKGRTAAGVFDLCSGALAMIDPDRIEYGASVPKIGILLAWFELNPDWREKLDARTREELGRMAKASSNEMAARFSQELGLRRIQEVLNSYGFYDESRGGGIWVGKHYGVDGERIADPVGGNSHAATVRQVLRFFLMLERGELVSPEASAAMREIFASPDIPHDPIKFVKGLAGREVHILRKWGSWEDWLHDSAIVCGPGRRYVLASLTRHSRGDDYLAGLAVAVDDLFLERRKKADGKKGDGAGG